MIILPDFTNISTFFEMNSKLGIEKPKMQKQKTQKQEKPKHKKTKTYKQGQIFEKNSSFHVK